MSQIRSGYQYPRVGLDLRPTEPGFKSHFGRGIGRYTEELVQRLLKFEPEQAGISFLPLSSQILWGDSWQGRYKGFFPLGKITLETQAFLPQRLSSLQLDLMHFFAHGDSPVSGAVARSVTVLDLIPLKFPELYKANKPTWRYNLARYLELKAIRSSKGIVAISQCTKRDLVEILGVDSEKVVVTPLAVSSKFNPREQEDWKVFQLNQRKIQSGIEHFSETRPMLLYVGGIDPRKNILFLLSVLSELREELPENKKPYLVIAGKIEKDDQYPRFLAEVSRLGLQNDVVSLGYVSDEQLVRLYQIATAFVFPSLYEGFGFPVLEAMSCGCPVVAGRNSSIPEVAGRAGLLVGDSELYGWVRAIKDLVLSNAMQQEFSLRGIEQAKLFSWDKTAEQTVEAYRQFLGIKASRQVLSNRRIGGLELPERDVQNG